MASGTPSPVTVDDLFTTYRFWIEVGSKRMIVGAFIECSGLEAQIEVEEWKEGGLNDRVHLFPGRAQKASNLVLRRGIATDELWRWYYRVTQGDFAGSGPGQTARQNLTIIVHGYDQIKPMRWTIEGALPVKWSGPTFKANASEVAVESIELIHKGLRRTS